MESRPRHDVGRAEGRAVRSEEPLAGSLTEARRLGEPTLAEDLLLVLFQPDAGFRGTGIIAGENTLFYVLAGAVLADLGLGGQVRPVPGRAGSTRVEAVAEKPRHVQTVLAAIGPTLRGPLLDRLVERGDIRRSSRRTLGVFPTKVLEDGGTGRRDELLKDVRAVLVDDEAPQPRVAALGALLSGSGTLPQFHREIPWTSPVITRAKELERGDWGAAAAAEAVTRTVSPSSAASSSRRPYALSSDRRPPGPGSAQASS
jgi:hypothetical protein